MSEADNIYEDSDGLSLAQKRTNSPVSKVVVIPAGPSAALQTSLSTIARQVDPQNAAKRIDDMTEVLNAFRKPQQWILVSPEGQMWAGDAKDLMRVLMTSTPIGSKFL